jgi:hypothetical protein
VKEDALLPEFVVAHPKHRLARKAGLKKRPRPRKTGRRHRTVAKECETFSIDQRPFIRQFWRTHFAEPRIQTRKPSESLLDFKILTESNIFPLRSAWALAGTLKISQSAIWDHSQKRPFVVKQLWWVSHALDGERKRTRAMMARSFLKTPP